MVAVSTAGTMLFGSMAAYVLARYKFFGNRFIYYLFVSGLAFPTFMALVPLFFILKSFGLLNTFTGLILVYIAYSLPFTVFFLAAFFKTLPIEIEEAATVDGASHTRKFFQIMVPMAKSGLVSITIFNIVGQWNQYLLPVAIMQGAGADSKWVLTQGIANISTSAGYQAEWSDAVRRADPLDPADDRRVRHLPAPDPGRPDRRRREVGPGLCRTRTAE